MHLIQLAFADDLRALELKATTPCAEDDDGQLQRSCDQIPFDSKADDNPGVKMVATIKQAVEKLRKNFNPDSYPNPGAHVSRDPVETLNAMLDLNFHYDCLQAIALNEELPPVVDETVSPVSNLP